jgi:ubiquinone/menaquinone biosynthesis C-methylase UbiE
MQNHEFDNYAKNYRTNCDKYVGMSGENSVFFAEYKAAKLHTWLPEYHDKECSILDFGCGDGVMTSYVKKFFQRADVTGVDPSTKSIEQAQELYNNITFSETDGYTLQFADNTFDIIFAAGAFHHIDFKDHEHHVKEIYRILKPGGRFVMFELNKYNPMTAYIFSRNPIDQHATMMSPIYGYNLVKKFGTSEVKFYCFFPKFLAALRPLETYMTKIPVGGLYAVLSSK